MKKFLFALAVIFVCGLGLFAVKAHAAELGVTIDSSDGSDGANLLDDDYRSTEHFDGGTTIILNADEAIDSVYIKWDSIPAAWTLKDGGSDVACGQNAFLHEYVKLSGQNHSATITIPDGGATIADVFAFSAGELPDYVQQWQPSWDRADILFISTHSDDEVLFFGGMIPIYTNENKARVQVAYFTDFFLTESYRNHELLDGIWTMGVDHYPQLGKFYDNYSESLEEAEGQFEHDECLAYIVETIRRFKPQVLVSHDENGEYGHGGHRYVSKLVREAVEITNDAGQYAESASTYGAWDVPKTYLHLWPENTIEMDTRAPLADFGGKNALDVAKDAYQKHGSQQWMWFYVDDGYDENGNPNGYEYSCAKYGLYRTLVGPDTSGNDVLDNIATYDAQEKKAEEESIRNEETTPVPKKDKETDKKGTGALVIILIIIAVIVVLLVLFYIVMRIRQNKKRAEMERRRRERARREAERRRQGQQRRPSEQRSSSQQQRRPSEQRTSGQQQRRTSEQQRKYSEQQRSSSQQQRRYSEQQRTSGQQQRRPSEQRPSGQQQRRPSEQRPSGQQPRPSGNRVNRSSKNR